MSKRRVVITGLGGITPLGNSIGESWRGALEGRSGIGRITRFDASAFPTQIAGEVKGLEYDKIVEPKELKKMDSFSLFSLAACAEAAAQSGFKDFYAPTKVGCILGVGLGGLPVLEKYHEAYLQGGPRKLSPFLIPAMISNLAPGNIAIKYGLKGPNFTTTSACTSANHAIGESYKMIAYGLCDAMVSGGAESAITPIGIGGFCAMKAMSTRNDEPTKASRPFDKDRDGFVMGEGAVVLVLEEYETAKKRGAPMIAEIVGYGTSCDAYHITAPCVDGEGAIACMRNALEDAQLAPEKIDYINAHGTSTPANDASETQAIKALFGNWAKSGLWVSSTKSVTGHLLGAAGAVEAAFVALALKEGIVPPTMNLDNPDEQCDLDYVPHKAREKKIKYAISNSYGFGGTNATLALAAV